MRNVWIFPRFFFIAWENAAKFNRVAARRTWEILIPITSEKFSEVMGLSVPSNSHLMVYAASYRLVVFPMSGNNTF